MGSFTVKMERVIQTIQPQMAGGDSQEQLDAILTESA
jgi:hypothetical protein